MGEEQILAAIGNLDSRVTRIEQYLPALATGEELQRAIAPLVTREELHRELQRAMAPLVTREALERRLLNVRDELREEILESRRRSDVLIEDLREDTRLILEHLLALSGRVDTLAGRR
jgi:hypothetical protein